jgi:hypothetical protein
MAKLIESNPRLIDELRATQCSNSAHPNRHHSWDFASNRCLNCGADARETYRQKERIIGKRNRPIATMEASRPEAAEAC